MIEIQAVSKAFGSRQLFTDFSLSIPEKSFVFLTGPSGCGKTTLLNMIGSLEPVDKGTVLVGGKDITAKRNQLAYLKYQVGFLFQNFALIEEKSVKENLRIIKNDCRSELSMEEALAFVGLTQQVNQKVYSLSGGEQQRIALARLLLKKCDLILADEPTGSLDADNANTVFSLLRQMNQSKTVVVVTHDTSHIAQGDMVVAL